jgi:hypothetical protein
MRIFEAVKKEVAAKLAVDQAEENTFKAAVGNTAVPMSRPSTTTSVAGTASSVTILAANANRKGFSVSNISSSKLYLSFTSPASASNCFIEMQPGAFLVFDQQLIVTVAIYGIWTNVNGTCQVTEFV